MVLLLELSVKHIAQIQIILQIKYCAYGIMTGVKLRHWWRKPGQLSPPAVNVALPAFAAAAPCCCGAGRAAIDWYRLPAGPTAANPQHAAAVGEWDRQADKHPMRAVPLGTNDKTLSRNLNK